MGESCRKPGRRWSAGIALIAFALYAACDSGRAVTSSADGTGAVSMALRGNIIAAPGALFEATVSYSVAGTVVVLARETASINTGGAPTALSLRVNIRDCLRDAAALDGTTCSLQLTTRLTRDGTLLDESVRTFTVSATTERIDIPPIELLEVASVVISPAIISDLEPGETQALTATALDRAGRIVTGRSLNFERISGGITVTTPGMITAVTAGPARVRAIIGGRSAELALAVQATSVATLQLQPPDTAAVQDGAFTYRVTARSASNEILAGRTVTFASSNLAVANVGATSGLVAAVAPGTVTITASSPNGRNGAIITSTTSLTVVPRPLLVVAPSTLTFDTEVGQPMPLAKTVNVTNGGAGSLGTVSVESVGEGLSATLSTSTAPAILTVRPTVAVAPGTTVARSVVLRSSQSGVSNAVVNVTIVGKQPPPIVVNRSTVAFTGIPTGGMSGMETVSVTTTAGRMLTGLNASVVYTPSTSPWLTATLMATTTATTLSLQVNAGMLSPGNYLADVTLSSLTDPHVPSIIRVTLEVVGIPRVVVSPKSVNLGMFSATVSAGPTSDVAITSSLATPIAGLMAVREYIGTGGWLGLQLLATTTATTLRLTPVPTGLPNGTYQARVIASSSTSGVKPDTVLVSMTVASPIVWAQVVVGDTHTCARSTTGIAYCWGNNSAGQLGNGTTISSNVPIRVSGMQTFSQLTLSGNHTCGRTSSLTVYCWGLNNDGQVGVGTLTNVLVPTVVSGGQTFSDIAAGWRHSCGVDASAQVYCWGNNAHGQLGNGTLTRATVPSLVTNSGSAYQLYLGIDYSCYNTSAFDYYCAGRNDYGQLGFGAGSDQPFAIYTGLFNDDYTAGGFHGCAVNLEGNERCWGNDFYGQLGRGAPDNNPLPANIVGGRDYNSLSGGFGHTCGIATDGTSYCWGNNNEGQLGIGSVGGTRLAPMAVLTTMQFASIKAGGGHSCALRADGALYCVGENIFGQLGNGANATTGTMVMVTQAFAGMPSVMMAQTCAAGAGACAATRGAPTVTPRVRKSPPPAAPGSRTAVPPPPPSPRRR